MLSAAILISAGCASKKPEQKEQETAFFPSPPELPRYQFLTSYASAADVVAGRSAFDKFVTGEQEDPRHFRKPYGVAIHDGKIYVCDSNVTVWVLDLKNRKFHPLQGARGLGKLVQPINISIDKDGNKYVSDPVRGQVVVFDRKDFFVKAIGMQGMWKPVDAVLFDHLLYVADVKNNEIKVIDPESGNIITTIGRHGAPEECLGIPTNLAFDRNGTLYVSDAGRFQIVMYDRDGHYLGKIGDPGQNPGYFARPRGVSVDDQDHIYAVDAAFDNVQIFNPEGQLLMFLGKAGSGPGDLFLPADVFIDRDNIAYFQQFADPNFQIEYLVLVTSQFGERLVNVFGYGHVRGQRYPTEEELVEMARERIKKWKAENPEETAGSGKDKD